MWCCASGLYLMLGSRAGWSASTGWEHHTVAVAEDVTIAAGLNRLRRAKASETCACCVYMLQP